MGRGGSESSKKFDGMKEKERTAKRIKGCAIVRGNEAISRVYVKKMGCYGRKKGYTCVRRKGNKLKPKYSVNF